MYSNGIPLTRFPPLFLDVITICRALRIQYLWIDALCIIQDSTDDWEMQSAQMASIYSNSYLTIAASSCSDTQGSLFTDRWTYVTLPSGNRTKVGVGSVTTEVGDYTYRIRHFIDCAHQRFTLADNAQNHVADAPLLTRAWAFQERLLPNRTLHFHAEELVWECKAGVRCECGSLDDRGLKEAEYQGLSDYTSIPKITPWLTQADPWLKPFVAQIDRPYIDTKGPYSIPCGIWMDLVSEFSRLSLTYEHDRLPALSGLAAKLSDKQLGRYVAGIWTEELPRLLLWEVCSDAEKPDRRSMAVKPSAPSWSWASVPLSSGVAVSYERAIAHSECTTSDVEVLNVVAKVIGKNPYGWVEDAILRVRGRTMNCLMIVAERDVFVLRREESEIGQKEQVIVGNDMMKLKMDYKGSYPHHMNVLVLFVDSYFGIALENGVGNSSGPPLYRRIGFVYWLKNRKDILPQNTMTFTEFREISIV